MDDRELNVRLEFDADFPTYAESCLKIRPKVGGLVSFKLNPVQERLNQIAETQREKSGKVRLIVLKARQPGISTYIEGRLYWLCTHNRGRRAFILTHSDDATSNLFTMARRFHENCPSMFRPQTQTANANELEFGVLDSGYRVGTARTKGVGRSDTIQYFHGSECAWWPAAEEHAAGVLQAVPDIDGTEIWIESTANGSTGLFHGMYTTAMNGESDYEAVFIPWFEHGEYATKPEKEWHPPPGFIEYRAMHKLTESQLYWSYRTNSELASADGLPVNEICWRFRQEYPATAVEAFRSSREGAFIQAELVFNARKADREIGSQRHAPLILGCDFARGERDYNWWISRRGRRAGDECNKRFHSGDVVDIAGRLARTIDNIHPDACFLDTGGSGAAVYDILIARNYRMLHLVNFGSAASDNRKYANKRAEMYGECKDWLADPGGASIPDDDVLDSELTASGFKYNANQQIVLEAKEKIRARLGISPDGADGLVLTFAEPVRYVRDIEGETEESSTSDGRNPITGY